jgi:acetoacetyl-CoA synthetase
LGNKLLWTPSQEGIEKTNLADFMKAASGVADREISDYDNLHNWSINDRPAFWSLIWDYCNVIGDKGERLLINDNLMPNNKDVPSAQFFPDSKLNFAENLLRKKSDDPAFVFWGEDKVKRGMSFNELHALTSKIQQHLISLGIKEGDRIACMLPNIPEAIAAMLAATSLGAIWSSCSPDFGEKGVLDRFGQIEPSLLFAVDGYYYNGKEIDVADKTIAIAKGLPSVKNYVVIDYLGGAENLAKNLPNAQSLEAAIAPYSDGEISFKRLPFSHPLYIAFSSGTTGVPKCIVHSAGGTLLQHMKEHRLHADIKDGDRVFYFTTLGWMMWNWLASALASNATIMLYDGSPFYPDGNIIFDYAEKERFTYFGTSAKFIDSVRKAELNPIKTHSLESIRTISSTGSPLSPEGFDFVYDGIKSDVHLASISGGTDIISCFVLGAPILPVYSGEIQAPALGMAVDVWDDDGNPIRAEKGELVCTKPFPSMPIGFWNDAKNDKYFSAYFDRFDNIWCHGDFAEITEHNGMIIHGRSDATLNPGGVRIGTAEIYNQVEQMDEVVEALCIGQDWDDDVRVVLFVRLGNGVTLDDDLIKAIKLKIRTGASPRHVPARILEVADLPRTKSGKITELAVREIIHGRGVKNKEALANPEALDIFENLRQELQN